MTPANQKQHIQTFRCSPRSNRAGATAKLYKDTEGYTLVLEGFGPVCAPRARFHAPWGRHSEQIRKVTVGEGITELESGIFSNLSGLEEVHLPGTLTGIYSEAFNRCTGLTTLRLPANLEYIGPRAFYQCTHLRQVSFGDRVGSIEAEAFAGCRQLERIHLPDRLHKIGDGAFSQCRALYSVTLSGNLNRVAPGVFQQCVKLRHIVIPPSVLTIEDRAFAKCADLRSLDLSQALRLRTVSNSAFNGCTSLQRVYIQEEQRPLCQHSFHGPETSILPPASRRAAQG